MSARLVVPDKQNIPIWLAIVVGIVGAPIGTFLAHLFGAPTGGISGRGRRRPRHGRLRQARRPTLT